MSLLGLFGRRKPSPVPDKSGDEYNSKYNSVPAYAGSRPGKSGFYALALADDRVLAGPFRAMARAGEVADAISAGAPWRWEAGD